MRRTMYLVLSLLVVTSMLVAACGGGAAAPAQQPAAPAPAETEAAAAPEATEAPAAEATEAPAEAATEEATEAPTEAPAAEAAATEAPPTATPVVLMEGRTPIRWFIGLGSGTDAQQQEAQHAVVDAFNASQDKIQLIMEVVPYNGARDALATQIASGNGPDIIGPVGWSGSNLFYGQYLDLAPLIEKTGYDLTQFSDELVKFNITEEGQIGLPFAVFPAAVFFQKGMFDEAGLNYPPSAYGEKYVWPDGTEEEWNYDTLTKVAKMLTVDANGNSPLDITDDGSEVPNPDFDRENIVQYGYFPQYQRPFHMGAFWGAASDIAEDGTVKLPENWKESWKWWYDGMWGEQPFSPTDPVVQSPNFGAGNPFNSGKIAMAITNQWYTCCIGDAGESWDLAVLPAYNGEVHGRVDADTFRIWKGTQHPDEAFEVLSYLIGEGAPQLLLTYGGMPSRAGEQDAFYAAKSEQFPWVENWESIKAGLAYPDIPSAEGYRPNFLEVFDRYEKFMNTLNSNAGLDMDAEIATLEADLNDIVQKAAE